MLFKINRSNCLVCGESIPLLRHMSITYFSGAECPRCHSYMRLPGRVYLLQFLLFILISPSIALLQNGQPVLGVFGLVFILFVSIVATLTASFVIDPAHKKRLNSKNEGIT